MHVLVGSDEATPLVDAIVERVRALGHHAETVAVGAPWPEVGRTIATAVASGDADRGVVCCWTGTGVSIAANKVAGARCALCTDGETAAGARRWNEANVLALSLRLTTPALAEEILEAFFSTDVDRDEAGLLTALEET